MPATIFNTLTRNKDPFVEGTPGHIGLYVCGPTVYDLSHVGHARVYVAFDVIQRFLRRHYKVTYVRNFTDIDDKIIKRAIERGVEAKVVAEENIQAFSDDMALLGNLRPDVEPKVSEHVDEIVALIGELVAQGQAYAAGGDVYFAVERFATYGKLGRRTLEDMEAGARVEVNTQKRHPMDFVLWKAAKPNEPQWPSPWGAGRPGWHIECSAMAKRYLGKTLDLHGGGRDLIFPHHENEVAQSEGAHGETYCRTWMHAGLVNIDNEKMSKSLGNFFTIRQVVEKFDPLTLRYYLLSTHYRSPINFSDLALREAQGRVRYLYETIARLDHLLAELPHTPEGQGEFRQSSVANVVTHFDLAMADDFNTPQALGDLSGIFKLVNEIGDHPGDPADDRKTLVAIKAALHEVGQVLGLFTHPAAEVLQSIDKSAQQRRQADTSEVERLLEQRKTARTQKNFGRSDAIRDQLLKMGVVIKDTPAGTTWHYH